MDTDTNDDGTFLDQKVTGTISNNTNKPYSYVEIDVNFFDSDGTQIESGIDNVQNLAGNGSWSFSVVNIKSQAASYKIVKVFGHR